MPKAVATLENDKVTLLKNMAMPTCFFIGMRVFCRFYIISMKALYLHGYHLVTDRHHKIGTLTKWMCKLEKYFFTISAYIGNNKSILLEAFCFA